MKYTILIIEDHPIYRDALAALLQANLDARVDSASTAEEGLASFKSPHHVDLILLDLGLSGLRGVDAVAALQRKMPSAPIIVVSASDERREVEAVLRLGAKAFVSKAVPSSQLLDTIRDVLDKKPIGRPWVSPKAALFESDSPASRALTPRQRQILGFLSQGLSNKEIGLRLELAEITVKIHVSSIFRVLGVANRSQAIVAARRFDYALEAE